MFTESRVLIFLLGFVVGALVAPAAIFIYLATWDTKTGASQYSPNKRTETTSH